MAPDAVILTSLFEGFVDDAITSVGALGDTPFTAVTLYDLIPYLNPDPNWPAHYKDYYSRKIASLKRADLLLSISDYSRQECAAALPELAEHIVNMSSACDAHFCTAEGPIDLAQLRGEFGIAKRFVMSAGNLEPRKNFGQLVRAFAALPAELRETYQLVLVGGAEKEKIHEIQQIAIDSGLVPGQLLVLGHVSDADLRLLYQACDLFVFPSLHEGFGLPPLEAMACGAVVIGSCKTSVPEVIGREDALFDPTSVSQLCDLMIRSLTDDDFRQSLREHAVKQAGEFSWDKTARRALGAIEERVGRGSSRDAGKTINRELLRKSRVALVTPLPPERTGIADYVADLIPALAELYDITVISDQTAVQPIPGNASIAVQSISWFKQHAGEFERIVYQMGNSPFHVHMLDLMKQYPGVVVLHDFYLSSLKLWMEASGYRYNAFKQSLLDSHGYAALEYLAREGEHAAKLEWPCSYDVIRDALGIVIHSEYSRDLICKYYGDAFAPKLSVVRQHRACAKNVQRKQARAALGYTDDDFVVCALGFMDYTKLNHVLLEAWGRSNLASDKRCKLVFVGGRDESDYGNRIDGAIADIDGGARIKITGFADHDTFKDYLSSADMAVQLRTHSRGETSRTVLDCLAHGIPLVVNANGPMAEYPNDTLLKLEDEFDVGDLVAALERLYGDAELRAKLRLMGPAYVEANHAPAKTAAGYAKAIEAVLRSERTQCERQAAVEFWASYPECTPDVQDGVAEKAAELLFLARKPHIYVDVSATARNDLKTGIERVARALLRELLLNPPKSCDVVPVYLSQENDQWHVRRAQTYLSSQQGFQLVPAQDELVIPVRGDALIALDLFSDGVVRAAGQGLYNYWRVSGAKVGFMVHDLLPITRPEFFPPWAHDVHKAWTTAICANSDMLICISDDVRQAVSDWLRENPPPGNESLPTLLMSHHGADVSASFPTMGLPEGAGTLLEHLSSRPTFLMVGTIEPRKGHLQTLRAFEQLWSAGVDVNLVIVGHEGWKGLPEHERRTIPEVVESIRDCPELGERLHWLEGISDEYLSRIYAASSCLLAPSEGEGYGLPLIEAAQHGLPIIARDIPVFREVAGASAYYFGGTDAVDLGQAVRVWLELRARGQMPDIAGLKWETWAQSAERLGQLLASQLGCAERLSAGSL